MEHPLIEWRKEYRASDGGVDYDIFIVANKVGHFNGAILYFEQNKNRKDISTEPAFSFKMIQFFSLTEDEVMTQIKKWFTDNVAELDLTYLGLGTLHT